MKKTIKTTIITATLLTSIILVSCNSATSESTPKNDRDIAISTETNKNIQRSVTRAITPDGKYISFTGHSKAGINTTGHSNGDALVKDGIVTDSDEFIYKNTHPQIWYVNGVPYLGNEPLFD